MTSLLTNTAAMVALQTLNQINRSLNTTNNRVSTGLRIAQAADSAAYWAIATTTDSDNGALSAVRDALAIGKSTLDVAYSGLESNRDSLQKLKELLVSGRQPGVNRANIQTEVDGLITDMVNKAGAAVINEQNFLEADSTGNTIKAIVASFERSSAGIAISTIDLDIASLIMVDTGATAGILDQTRTIGAAGPQQFANSILSLAGTTISNITDSVDDLALLENIITAVDNALTEVISAQNTVGVNLARAESQETFVAALMDANERAVGALIDANMEEESTKLRALQTQQQLSVESLAIANASAQNVLALFQ
ncbi:flagellin [Acuticoccus sp. I52.16.1]|uniref:flagellin N-terminal helical domain-containing protein n=1 Tax=Acuticoccus sp. I52.16.1 TaxID=2928472 RepID=UPI001FD291D8|nr:flagellin [Acuticoccus sp. I52.16.1]UOM34293.1 flagellin [Acuticoccus sp. I52.16.1]